MPIPPKKKSTFLLPIATAEQSALLLELFQKAAVPASQAHHAAALWSAVERCAAHFKEEGNERLQ